MHPESVCRDVFAGRNEREYIVCKVFGLFTERRGKGFVKGQKSPT
jgi:hypothetical protein